MKFPLIKNKANKQTYIAFPRRELSTKAKLFIDDPRNKIIDSRRLKWLLKM